jgi:hypothetical protein
MLIAWRKMTKREILCPFGKSCGLRAFDSRSLCDARLHSDRRKG